MQIVILWFGTLRGSEWVKVPWPGIASKDCPAYDTKALTSELSWLQLYLLEAAIQAVATQVRGIHLPMAADVNLGFGATNKAKTCGWSLLTESIHPLRPLRSQVDSSTCSPHILAIPDTGWSGKPQFWCDQWRSAQDWSRLSLHEVEWRANLWVQDSKGSRISVEIRGLWSRNLAAHPRLGKAKKVPGSSRAASFRGQWGLRNSENDKVMTHGLIDYIYSLIPSFWRRHMAMDQYLLIPFLVGWTSINPSYFDVH